MSSALRSTREKCTAICRRRRSVAITRKVIPRPTLPLGGTPQYLGPAVIARTFNPDQPPGVSGLTSLSSGCRGKRQAGALKI